ncbi:MFS transporter [Solwaraspora sp. WMMD406]|uniref:MFS transporter n=1 Tax=Solwaraspora sp. WMMD406 TaxID=3016095 RepID=UPI002415EF85|nr:MFS transporter [Solwaraspora sp. WMMD406]MDG4766786.1 MFS transporter [Solwaraspora sp. WMMD406]
MVADTFLMGLGFYALVPLLAYHLLNDLGLSIALTGLLAGVRSASQQGMMLWSGMLADRFGHRRAICLGVLLRAAGFTAFGVVDSVPGLAVASVLAGLGGSLFHPASYALYAELTPAPHRTRAYAVREMASNVAFVLGPALGGLLAAVNFPVLCFVAAGLFLVAGAITWIGLRPDGPTTGTADRTSSLNRLRTVARDRDFRRFVLVSAGAWALFSQLYLAVPVRVGQVLPGTTSLGLVYTVAAVVMVAATVPLTRLAERYLTTGRTLAIATVMLASGLWLLGVLPGPAGVVTGVVVFTLGQVLLLPTVNGTVSRLAPPGAVASYFGANGLVLALGGLVGNLGGGWLLDLDGGVARWLPWTAFAAWGLAAAIAYVVVLRPTGAFGRSG